MRILKFKGILLHFCLKTEGTLVVSPPKFKGKLVLFSRKIEGTLSISTRKIPLSLSARARTDLSSIGEAVRCTSTLVLKAAHRQDSHSLSMESQLFRPPQEASTLCQTATLPAGTRKVALPSGSIVTCSSG